MQRKMWAENAEAYRKLANCNIVFRFQPMLIAWTVAFVGQTLKQAKEGEGSARSLGS